MGSSVACKSNTACNSGSAVCSISCSITSILISAFSSGQSSIRDTRTFFYQCNLLISNEYPGLCFRAMVRESLPVSISISIFSFEIVVKIKKIKGSQTFSLLHEKFSLSNQKMTH